MATDPLLDIASRDAPLECALEVALVAHLGQVDKAGESYILHIIRVVAAMETPDERIVAALHDVLEDTEVTEAELRVLFKSHIVDAIVALSRPSDLTYQEYIRSKVAPNPLARLVKIADLKDNLNPQRLSKIESPLSLARRYEAALRTLTEAE